MGVGLVQTNRWVVGALCQDESNCPVFLQPAAPPEPTPTPTPAPPPAPVASATNTEDTQKLTQNLSKLQDELSLAEREKLKVLQVPASVCEGGALWEAITVSSHRWLISPPPTHTLCFRTMRL